MSNTKLKVVYSPEGGSPRSWVVDLANPAWDIKMQTEKATDWPWEPFVQRFMQDSAIAMQALLWVLRKRDEPRLDLDSVEVDMDELEFEATCTECGDWLTSEDEDHTCAVPEKKSKKGKEPAEAAPGEA